MHHYITLGGKAYNPRTKGKIKTYLIKLIGKENFMVLGNGGSFTGFYFKYLSEENIEKIQIYLNTEKFPSKTLFSHFESL
jgi:hypothetical protein